VSFRELTDIGIRADVAFLAACWSAAPNRALPEESISYQSATLRAGARCVIAPLWPVEDAVTQDLVTTFYEHWLGHGSTVMEAFTVAVTRCRDQHPSSTTWAAFTIHGAAFDTR
jgi:CHAT domain-containing protein